MVRRQRGGVLWDIFLIVLVCAAGFAVWKTRGRWEKPLRETLGRWVPASAPAKGQTTAVDLKSVSASAHTRLMDILANSGVKEKHVARTFTEERTQEGAVWLESTAEINRPKTFQEGSFLRLVLIDIAENKLALMKDEKENGAWTLEVGDRVRVYQRFRFRNPSHS